MGFHPGQGESEEARCRRARRADFPDLLGALADHVEGATHRTWLRLREAAEKVDRNPDGLFGHVWSEGLGDLATGLVTGDGRTWTRLFLTVLGEGSGYLSEGEGARLKALSPYAGKTLVTYCGHAVGGEVGEAFRQAMALQGEEPGFEHAYLLALEPGDVTVPGPRRHSR